MRLLMASLSLGASCAAPAWAQQAPAAPAGAFDPKVIAAVWDVAHNALNGEALDLGLDIIWPHLNMVNFKNAYWHRTNGPEAVVAEWDVFWTSGRHGQASWSQVATLLKQRGYSGVVCLPAEYTDEPAVDRLIAEDIIFAKSLF